jgi:hypothetical protein
MTSTLDEVSSSCPYRFIPGETALGWLGGCNNQSEHYGKREIPLQGNEPQLLGLFIHSLAGIQSELSQLEMNTD